MTKPEAAPAMQGPDAPVDPAERQNDATSAPGRQEHARKETPNLGPSSDERPAQQSRAAAGNIKNSAGAPTRTIQFATAALAAMGFLASGILYLAGARRRRRAAVLRIVDLNVKAPLRTPAAVGIAKSVPAPMDVIPRRDEADADIEERLRRFSQAWKRRAA